MKNVLMALVALFAFSTVSFADNHAAPAKADEHHEEKADAKKKKDKKKDDKHAEEHHEEKHEEKKH